MGRRSIDVWYGNGQELGFVGIPQRWYNVLGRVGEAHELQSLHATLNQTPLGDLSIGPDGRRLVGEGDFNIEVDVDDLTGGSNHLQVHATYRDGEELREFVELCRRDESPIAPSCRIDWEELGLPNRYARVVDGRWEVRGRYVCTREAGYDRLIAVGDLRWRDFEVQVPLVVHAIERRAYDSPTSVHTGVGIVMRWKGHSHWPPHGQANGQPRIGPVPYGAIAWWTTWAANQRGSLNFFDVDLRPRGSMPRDLEIDRPYVLRSQVRTREDGRSTYRMKLWPENETEPDRWDATLPAPLNSLDSGSLLLVAHETAASFGPVIVRPI